MRLGVADVHVGLAVLEHPLFVHAEHVSASAVCPLVVLVRDPAGQHHLGLVSFEGGVRIELFHVVAVRDGCLVQASVVRGDVRPGLHEIVGSPNPQCGGQRSVARSDFQRLLVRKKLLQPAHQLDGGQPVQAVAHREVGNFGSGVGAPEGKRLDEQAALVVKRAFLGRVLLQLVGGDDLQAHAAYRTPAPVVATSLRCSADVAATAHALNVACYALGTC